MTADNGEPLEEWDPTKCGCEKALIEKFVDGSWLCGMSVKKDMNEEDKANATAMAEADKLVNKITGAKARVLDALINKLKKIHAILSAGLNKRSHNRYAFKRISYLADNIVKKGNNI